MQVWIIVQGFEAIRSDRIKSAGKRLRSNWSFGQDPNELRKRGNAGGGETESLCLEHQASRPRRWSRWSGRKATEHARQRGRFCGRSNTRQPREINEQDESGHELQGAIINKKAKESEECDGDGDGGDGAS